MRALARAVLANADLRVEGREHVPVSGPALLVCRHYHHLYDGAALLVALNRPVRIVAGLDWAKDAATRRVMEALCGWARWPVVVRPRAAGAPAGAYDPAERRRYARAALNRAAELLRGGELLAIFPAGRPEIDPHAPPPPAAWLPFARGYLAIAQRAARGGVPVPLVPVGFLYNEAPGRAPKIAVRFGPPQAIGSPAERSSVAGTIEERVRALSV
jgi:putative membrane protein